MKLKSPPKDIKMVRRKARGDVSAGAWHFPKEGRTQKMLCGAFITIWDSLDDSIEVERLDKITKGKICPSCWPWGIDA